jgi:hypothetical protein
MGAVFSLSLPYFIKEYRTIHNKNIKKTQTVNFKNRNICNLNKIPYII